MATLTHRMRVLRHLAQQEAALKVKTFASPDAFFEAVLGPRQHDAHVQRYRREQWLMQKRTENAARLANVRKAADEICAQARAARGAQP